MAFVEDSQLGFICNLAHLNEQITEGVKLSPTLEHLVVLTWLCLINAILPKLVTQRYGTDFRSRTLASLKAELSQAKNSLVDEIASTDEAKVIHAETTSFRTNLDRRQHKPPTNQPRTISSREKSCYLCKELGHPDRHFLSECRSLPERDRNDTTKARKIGTIFERDD